MGSAFARGPERDRTMIPKGLQPGDVFTDAGRTFEVTGVNRDGSYLAALAPKAQPKAEQTKAPARKPKTAKRAAAKKEQQ